MKPASTHIEKPEMKALVKQSPEVGLVLTTVPTPQTIQANEVLIKIKKTAICGTDVHIYQWDAWAQATIPTPMHIGHEFMGHVVQTGTQVQHLNPGDRVSGEGHLTCGRCRNCLAGTRHLCPNTQGIGVNIPGAFAEYLVLPAANVFPLPEGISDEIAAIMDPYGNAVHTALSFNCTGEDVLVVGAGPIGQMAALICQHIGARHVVITDVNPARLELSRTLGIEHCINTQKTSLSEVIKTLNMQEGFDVALEMSGQASALNEALSVMINGGRIAQLGIFKEDKPPLDLNTLVFKGITLKGIYGREIFETWYKMITLIESGLNIQGIITHHYPLEQFEDAFSKAMSGEAGKVILTW